MRPFAMTGMDTACFIFRAGIVQQNNTGIRQLVRRYPGKIRQDLTTLLTHPQFKERIDSIARRYESLEGMSLLETAVQEQLGSHPVSL